MMDTRELIVLGQLRRSLMAIQEHSILMELSGHTSNSSKELAVMKLIHSLLSQQTLWMYTFPRVLMLIQTSSRMILNLEDNPLLLFPQLLSQQ